MIIDTHVLLWWLESSPRLSRRVTRILTEGDETMFWSVASSWEVAIKVSSGRLVLPRPYAELVDKVIPGEGLDLLQISNAHLLQVAALPHHHHDPFDRMLIAQAIVERLPVITADPSFEDYDVKIVW